MFQQILNTTTALKTIENKTKRGVEIAYGLLCMASRHFSTFANKYPVTYFQRPLADNYIWLIYILSVYNPN